MENKKVIIVGKPTNEQLELIKSQYDNFVVFDDLKKAQESYPIHNTYILDNIPVPILKDADIYEYGETHIHRNANIVPARNSKTNPKYNMNEQCYCDSGKKYKNCCLNKDNNK